MTSEEFLKKTLLFDVLTPLELKAVTPFLELRKYKEGDELFHEGDEGPEMFLLVSGRVESVMGCPDGTTRKVGEFGPKELFGEMSIIEGAPRSASCRALTDTMVLVLSGIDFFRLTWDHPVLGTKILTALSKILIQRLSQASSFLDDMARWGETARKRAVTDDLTGLYNRRFLEESLTVRFLAPPKSTSILVMDLDRFRDINNEFGALAGDAVIANVGVCILQVLRPNDIPARLSGDEFTILLPDTTAEEAQVLAEEIRKAVEDLYLEFRVKESSLPRRVYASVSIGGASYPSSEWSQKVLLETADRALYQAKASGKNCVRFL